MATESDSGRRALAGFLYQTLASAAHAFQALEPYNSDGNQFEVSFALERHGQDADSVTDNGTARTITFYQYKYSSDALANPIDKTDLFQILDSFEASEAKVNVQGYNSVKFQLISNRKMHDNVKKLKVDADRDLPNQELDGPDTKKLNGKTITVRTKPKKATLKRILKDLVFDDSIDMEVAKGRLRERAAALGVSEGREFERGLESLMGFLFDKASSATRKITLDMLNEKLGGYRNAKSLMDNFVQKKMFEKLQSFENASGIKKPLARRRVIDDIHAKLEHCLVIVEGLGGVGKTTAVVEVVNHLLKANKSPPPFALISVARDVDEYWIGKEVSSWRGSSEPGHLHESIELALQRLETAASSVSTNSAVNPIVILVLDALDEIDTSNERRAKMREILKFFIDRERSKQNNPSRATLVVTCRDRTELSDLNLGGWDQPQFTKAIVTVLPFDDSELYEAAVAAELSASVMQRIQDYSDSEQDRSSSRSKQIAEQMQDAIRYPAIWRCFRELTENQQHAALNGERHGLDEIAKRFVNWFCNKVCRRIQQHNSDVRMILKKVVENFDHAKRFGERRTHWINPAGHLIGDVVANRVWEEAISAGFISIDSVQKGQWQWKHFFVYEYLRDNDSESIPGEK